MNLKIKYNHIFDIFMTKKKRIITPVPHFEPL